MTDFYSRLSAVLASCGKDHEEVTKKICSAYPDLKSLAAADPFVVNSLCDEKYTAMIRVISAIAGRRRADNFKFGKTHTQEEIFDYLVGFYYDIVNETVLIMPKDERGRIICAEVVLDGTVNLSGIVNRKILEVMVKHGAKSALLAHNHPAGKATPSVEDVETTRIVSRLLLSSGMKLDGHYVVAGNDVVLINGEDL